MECGSIDVVPLHKVLQLWISKQYAMVLAVSVTRIPISCPCFSLPVSSLPLPWLLPSQRSTMLHVRLLLFNRGFVRGLLVGCAPSLLFCHLKAHPAFSTKCWSRKRYRVGLHVAERESGGRKIFPMSVSYMTLCCCLQQEKLEGDNSTLPVRSNHLGNRQ